MDSSISVTSRKSFGLPKPETGLAEWTSKIKALQKEVDADEEAEQKRLEDEIAAARQARLSRSRGTSATRANSSDLSINRELQSFTSNQKDHSAINATITPSERKINQETALRKLMERNEVYNPDTISSSARGTSAKQDGGSLAAFIGGNATGPRLNRHAPQPDAHDPTQFIQPDLSRPHPVFGRGGVAMPGMSTKHANLSSSDVGSEHSERYRPSSLASAKSMSSLRSSYTDNLTAANQSHSIGLNRRSFNGPSKPVSPTPGQNLADEGDPSFNLTSGNEVSPSSVPRPKSPPTASRALSSKEEIGGSNQTSKLPDTFQSNQTPFESVPKSIAPTAPSYTRGFSGSPTKSPEPSWAKQTSVNSGLRTSPASPSYLQKPENTVGTNSSTSSTKGSTGSFRSMTTSFIPPAKDPSVVTVSYLPKKEETTTTQSSRPKSTDAFRASSTSTTPRTLPSYLGTTSGSSKSTSQTVNASTGTADTPLRRLMDRNNVYNPDRVDNSRKSVAERAQTVSLGAFMGGNGTGIRLNRHAPQPDATDPTQFIQPDLSAPHPIFGKGGIAMPGMTTRKSDTSVEGSERYRPSATARPTWPPVSTSRTNKVEERPVSPQKTGNRERTTSTPNSQVQTSFQSSSDRSSSNKVTGRQSPVKETRPETIRSRTISGPSYSDNYDNHVSRPLSFQSSVSIPSLARPVQSIPKASSISPQIPITLTPSPAFQRPPPPKDLTPSLSRLQGRGFVQNMVKVSTQYETLPSPSRSVEKPRPVSSGGRPGSVLDRWQPNVQSRSPTKTSFSPSSTPTKKMTATFESNDRTSKAQPIKPVASMPSVVKGSETSTTHLMAKEPPEISEHNPRPRTPGLGSATTMVLIKPKKSSTDLTHLSHVDELGVKHGSWKGQEIDDDPYRAPVEVPPSPKKTLIHPANDRPKEPEKDGESLGVTEREIAMAADQYDMEAAGMHTFIRSLTPVANVLGDSDQPCSEEDTVHPPEQTNDTPNILTPNGDQFIPLSPRLNDNQTIAKESETEIDLPSSHPAEVESPSVRVLDAEVVMPSLNTPSIQPIEAVPPSPTRHTRIPSTGNRPTVMEIAQTLLETPVNNLTASETFTPNEPDLPPLHSVPAPNVEPIPRPRVPLSQIQAEKRRSNYEKYSAIILPSLKEEPTPDPSPANTLARANDDLKDALSLGTIHQDDSSDFQVPESVVALNNFQKLANFDYSRILAPPDQAPKASADIQTISVEVLVITGTTATPLSKSPNIFYDSEILVIVHRVKSKSSGLASTFVWCWLGRKCTFGDREERKVHDLANRYGTRAKIVHQFAEPPTLIQLLGDQLAIRQGTRTHWSSENTTMHLVRALRGCILIDEHDLSIRNLSSAFSYCITILGSIYVWHGCGSTLQERNAAIQYSQTFSADSVVPVVLNEGEDDNDEMFWMILGDEEFARANYWKWRKSSIITDPSCWRVMTDDQLIPMAPVEFLSMEQDVHHSIYIINCIWEFFVMVGKEARADRRTIKFALDLVTKLSMEAASSRPYVPTVHVLILPSQVPLDLRIGIRDLDEAWLNDGEIPDHMNLVHSSDANDHLSTSSWEHKMLKDGTTLPFGIESIISEVI